MVKIQVFSDEKRFERYSAILNTDALVKALVSFAEKADIPETINIVFIGNEAIRELNRNFRKIDVPTDVLSFNYKESVEVEPKSDYNTEAGSVGEVYISIPYLESTTRQSQESFERALKQTAMHGILHLAGYDHENEQDRVEMERRGKDMMKIIEKRQTDR